MWIDYNPNPRKKNTGDCAVRAIAKALGVNWEQSKVLLDIYSMDNSEVETSDLVWGEILFVNGFEMIPLNCTSGCDLVGFCKEHNRGTYVVKLPNHVVCVVDGDYYDSWDSGREVPIYCWRKTFENM